VLEELVAGLLERGWPHGSRRSAVFLFGQVGRVRVSRRSRSIG
jgi:hypothetical protein